MSDIIRKIEKMLKERESVLKGFEKIERFSPDKKFGQMGYMAEDINGCWISREDVIELLNKLKTKSFEED